MVMSAIENPKEAKCINIDPPPALEDTEITDRVDKEMKMFAGCRIVTVLS